MSYWRLYYHIVYSTHNREPLIAPEYQERLFRATHAKVTALGGTLHALGGTADHVHLVAAVPPKVTLSRFVGEVKGSTAHFVNHEVRPAAELHWQNEYGILSLDSTSLDRVVRYVLSQAQHHSSQSTIPALEQDGTADRPGVQVAQEVARGFRPALHLQTPFGGGPRARRALRA